MPTSCSTSTTVAPRVASNRASSSIRPPSRARRYTQCRDAGRFAMVLGLRRSCYDPRGVMPKGVGRGDGPGSRPGLFVVDKPAGGTSHDVVGRCRRIFGTRRVGHAGTLDPMATGVLVIGIARATKILGLLSGASKSYAATIRLGQTTSTEDAEGQLLQQISAEQVADETIAT